MDESVSEHTGRPLEAFEDAALLTRRTRFADDLPAPRGTLHAAIMRSPHAHAEILSIDPIRARYAGYQCIVTGEDAQRWTRPFTTAVKSPIEYWCLATGSRPLALDMSTRWTSTFVRSRCRRN